MNQNNNSRFLERRMFGLEGLDENFVPAEKKHISLNLITFD